MSGHAPHPPWQALASGRPREALRWWRANLLASPTEPYLQAAAAGLGADPLARQRRQALALLAALAAGEPGEAEQQQLGALLRGWGDQCLRLVPSTAQVHYERAWVCGRDAALTQRLADLYARQGLARGARALAVPRLPQPPWPQPVCVGLSCRTCATAVQQAPLPAAGEPELQLQAFPGGRIWLEIDPTFHATHGLAVADRHGQLQSTLCRRYPGHWPSCPQQGLHQQQALEQLAWQVPEPVLQIDGPVLAVADLSAGLYYHGQLELLPRLGRSWQQLHSQHPNLRLWHNGGDSPWLREALSLLGIAPEQVICGHRHPHLQAANLLVPSYPSPFGNPGPRSLAWLRGFWGDAVAAMPASAGPTAAARGSAGLLLERPTSGRRPLLQSLLWRRHLEAEGVMPMPPGLTVRQQLQALQGVDRVVAAHGGAMANLLLLPPGSHLLELTNPAYAPPYFASLVASGRLQHTRQHGANTPPVLQDLLYIGPLEWPIDCPPP